MKLIEEYYFDLYKTAFKDFYNETHIAYDIFLNKCPRSYEKGLKKLDKALNDFEETERLMSLGNIKTIDIDENKKGGFIRKRYEIDKSIKLKSKDFADNSLKDYSKRNQKNLYNITHQIYVGKLIEHYTEVYFRENKKNIIIKPVDWEIYNYNDKSFDSDLVIGRKIRGKIIQKKISCKSSYMERSGYTEKSNGEKIKKKLPYQHSYTYQFNNNDNNGGKDKGDHDIYVFGNYLDENIVEIYAWIDSKYVKKMMVKPFSSKLKDTKRCIMQKTCCETKNEYPCGIDELLIRR
jgi:hypothetical protein